MVDDEVTDWSGSKELSEVLVGRIKVYWAERGYYPEVWTVPMKGSKNRTWIIRSDMLNGRPRN